MVAQRRSKRQLGGNEQLVNVLQGTPISDILEDFQTYNQLLQEECYLVFSQLQASGQLLTSPHVSAYTEEFGDNSFTEVKQAFDTLMNELEADEFVIDTVFTDATNATNATNATDVTNATNDTNANVVTGGGINFGIDLSNITPETVENYSTKILLSIIQRYQSQYNDLSLQQQQSLTLCITEYQVKAMTSLNKLYLGDVGISCMLYGAFANMGELLRQYDGNGGDLSQWMSSTASLARQSVAMSQQALRGLATKTEQIAKTVAKAAHQDIAEMPLNKKMNILQNLFGDMLKWGGKQLMLRLRAPEFDIASVSDMASFKEEMLKFIGNRIEQIMTKSANFGNINRSANTERRKEYLKWILSILENIDSLLSFIKTLSQLSLPTISPDFGVKVDVKASMSTGIKVNIEPSEWLKEIGKSVDGLKTVVDEKKDMLDSILGVNLYEIIREGEATKKQKDTERQLALLTINIQAKEAILNKQPNNNIIRAELGRLITLKDKLIESNNQKSEEIQETCIQLLQEIHMFVTSMDIPHIPLDIITKQIIKEVATKVDYSAFTSVARNVSRNVVSEVSKFDIGLRAYFGCIGKYLEFVPNISNLYNHIGFTLPDLNNVIDKLGTVSGFISSTVSSAGAYLQIVNVCLLLIHLVVSASLNCRNKTINKERVTLADIKKASQERMTASSSSSVSSLPKIGVRGGKLIKKIKQRRLRGGSLPPLMYSQGRTLQMRKGLVDQSHTMPFFVQGRKSIMNERIKQHSITLLEPQFTKDEILRTLLTKSMNSSTQLGQNLIGNVNSYMYANEQTLDNGRSVLDNLKTQLPQLNSSSASTNATLYTSCSTMPSQLSSQEDIYVLSIFSAYQGQQLRKSFGFHTSTQHLQKPSQDSLYCKVSQRMHLDDERLQKIVASIVSNFNGDTMIGGNKNKKKRSIAMQSFLENKTTKDLYAYATSKALRVTPSMSKQNLITAIINTRLP
jgi:hypothetical protein